MAKTDAWTWKVVYSNPVMGFSKTFDVAATSLDGALSGGATALAAKGYTPADFEPIEVKRVRSLKYVGKEN